MDRQLNTMSDSAKIKPAFGYGYIPWPKQTPLEERLYGKIYHHDLHCNAGLRAPMGCPGCSCYYAPGRHK